MVGVSGIIDSGCQSQVAEARCLARSHVDDGSAVSEFHLSALVAFEQIRSDTVFHFHIAGDAVFVELYFYLCLLSGLIQPIGVVGNGYPQAVVAVRIILAFRRDSHDGQKQ